MIGILIIFISLSSSIISSFEEISTAIAPKNGVSITFDDGPHPKHTDEILDILKQKKVHATFFIIGLHIPRDEKVIMREVREGHTLGGHSYSHQNFSKLSMPDMAKEVLFPHLKMALLTGKYPTYFRFPYGIDDIRIRNFYSGKIIGWNVDAYDWKAKNPKILAKKIIDQTRSGSIILLHDIKEDTVKALPLIIDGIRAKNLEFTPLPSLIASSHKKRESDIIHYSQYKTGSLHDHRKSEKVEQKSTEEILKPIIITEVAPW